MRRVIGCALLVVAGTAAAQVAPPRTDETRARLGGTFSSQASWDANALFAAPGGADDASGRVDGAVALGVEGPLTALHLAGGGGVMRYRRLSGMNATLYSMAGDVTRRATPRLTLRAAADARTTLARELTTVEPASGSLPLALTRTRSASGTLRYAVDARSTASVEGEYSTVDFDSPALADASRQRVGARIERALASGLSGTLTLDWNREVLWANARHLYELSTALASKQGIVFVRGRLGTNLMTAHATRTRVIPAGEFTVGTEGRIITLSLGYTRRVVQSYDVGHMESSDELTGRAGLKLGCGTELSMSGGGVRMADVDAAAATRRLYGAEGEFRQRLGGALSIVGGAYARQRTRPQAVATYGFRFSLETRIGTT